MMKFFNTEGPIIPEDHYFLPHRLPEQELLNLIERKRYFVLHAPRQTGKTTEMMQFVKKLNKTDKYTALYVNVEPAQVARGKVREGIFAILKKFLYEIENQIPQEEEAVINYLKDTKNLEETTGSHLTALEFFLNFWAKTSLKPLVLFIDEIDSLVGDTLISVLRQLRSSYPYRPNGFPQSLCLIGVRDVRDYRIWSEETQALVLGGSAFNIKSESLRLADFTQEEVKKLYEQHTQETGQQFTLDAVEHAFYLTQGQPWLVNALAYQACFRDVQDHTKLINKEMIDQAKEALILRRDTHLDVLVDRLQEPRVRNIVDAILSGFGGGKDFKTDDLQYVRDLGLVSQKGIKIANPIYQEIIPRELMYTKQESLVQETIWYQNPDGSLNMNKLIKAFQEFFRENSEIWLEKFAYKEAGPHLLMMAFLQRILNSKGKLHREYALGRKRVDLLIQWRNQRIVIELKILRNKKTLTEGLQQTANYMDTNNATEGHLVIFDRDSEKKWSEKIYSRSEKCGEHGILVWGM